MALVLNALLSLAFAASIAGAVNLWRLHMERARRDDLQALAARRGWALTITGQRLGRAGTLRIAPRGGLRWTVETRAESGARPRRMTEYVAEAPVWADGLLIVTPAPPEPTAGATREAQADAVADAVLLRLGEEVARATGPMLRRPSPSRILVLSDTDPTRRVDLADIARLFAEWRPTATGDRGLPVLVLSSRGLRLRVGHPVVRADHMERLVDLALGLSRLIGP